MNAIPDNSNECNVGASSGPSSSLRGAMLLVGAVGCGTLAALVPLLDRDHGRFVLSPAKDWVAGTVPTWMVFGAAAGTAIGGLGLLLALFQDRRLKAALAWAKEWLRDHRKLGVLLGFLMLASAISWYELFYDPFNKQWGNDGHGGLRIQLWLDLAAAVLRRDRQLSLDLAAALLGGLRKQVLRGDVQLWLGLAAAVLGGLAISAWWPGEGAFARWAGRLGQSLSAVRRAWRWWVLAAAVPCVLGAAMSRFALDGIPHFSDALTYLMQGRMLMHGELSTAKPAHPELWIGSLFFITDQQHVDPVTHQMVYDGTRFFGKYPIGWPTIVGLFDHVHLLFLANAALAGLAAVLTGLVARQFASHRVAVLAALLFGFSPWVWFHGADFASHVASTCALLAFLWLYLKTANQSRNPASPTQAEKNGGAGFLTALGAGLALGAAVLIRPGDATNFALPVVVVTIVFLVRQPKRWLILGTLISLGALVGVGVYLWTNARTTGSAMVSPYKLEPRWSDDWKPAPLAMAGRFLFQWTELNGRFPGWGLGGLTVAVMGVIAYRWQNRKTPSPVPIGSGHPLPEGEGCKSGTAWGLWLLIACTVLFFCFNTTFGFTNVWWGPRWLLPAAPLLAILGAFLVDVILEKAAEWGEESRKEPSPQPSPSEGRGGGGATAQLALAILLAGLCVGLFSRYGGQFYQNRAVPPHRVSGTAARAAKETLGLRKHGVVVAMDPSGERPPLDARAGMAFMQVPFESNFVIYVRAVEGWEQMARGSFPDRDLYRMRPDPNATWGIRFDLVLTARSPAGVETRPAGG